jgi:hypothetical protein
MKLTIELVPSSSWGNNLRDEGKLPKKRWDELRRECYRAAGNRCEICGGVGSRHPVECHEIWSYEGNVQKLEGLIALCPMCHRAKHIGHTLYVLGSPIADAVLNHIKRVNEIDDKQLNEMIMDAFELYEQRSQRKWSVDISLIS